MRDGVSLIGLNASRRSEGRSCGKGVVWGEAVDSTARSSHLRFVEIAGTHRKRYRAATIPKNSALFLPLKLSQGPAINPTCWFQLYSSAGAIVTRLL